MLMAEKTTYVIELNDKLSPGLKRAISKAAGLDNQMKQTGKRGARNMMALEGAITRLVGPLALAAAGMKAFQFASESVKVARDFEALGNAITFASGSAEEGAKNMGFLRDRAELLGTDLQASAEGFKTLSSSMIGSSLEGQATRDIFDGVQVAASVMGLSAEDAKGTFLALGQIMGKGKVQAEELRGQIGERIPGAFNIAARAMGVSTAELNKMMEQGQLVAEDFLPKFSDELKKTFGPGLKKSVNSAQANFNRFNNTMLELKLQIGKFLLPIVNRLMDAFKRGFDFLKANFDAVKMAFSPFLDMLKEGYSLITDFFNSISGGSSFVEMFRKGLEGIYKVFNFLKPVFMEQIGFLKSIGGLFVKLFRALGDLGTRFPIIAKTFRAFVFVAREGFTQIWKAAKNTLSGVGDLIAGIFSGDTEQIKKGLSGLKEAFNPVERGKAMAEAWKTGFEGGFKGPDLKVSGLAAAGPTSFDDVLKGGAGATGTGAAAIAGGAAAGKKKSESLTGVKSGRPTHINIDIGKLIETFNVTATNLDDMNNKAKDLVAQALLSAVNNVNNIAR